MLISAFNKHPGCLSEEINTLTRASRKNAAVFHQLIKYRIRERLTVQFHSAPGQRVYQVETRPECEPSLSLLAKLPSAALPHSLLLSFFHHKKSSLTQDKHLKMETAFQIPFTLTGDLKCVILENLESFFLCCLFFTKLYDWTEIIKHLKISDRWLVIGELGFSLNKTEVWVCFWRLSGFC